MMSRVFNQHSSIYTFKEIHFFNRIYTKYNNKNINRSNAIDILSDLFQKQNAIICGDFNAKSVLWGSTISDTRGRTIERLLDDSDKVCLNTGSPTRFESCLDLAFSSSIAAFSKWEVLSENCGSDHNIVQ